MKTLFYYLILSLLAGITLIIACLASAYFFGIVSPPLIGALVGTAVLTTRKKLFAALDKIFRKKTDGTPVSNKEKAVKK